MASNLLAISSDGVTPRLVQPIARFLWLHRWATSNKKLLGAPGIATSNKKLLGAPGLTTRSKDATRGSWHRYYRSKDATRGSWPDY